MNRLLIALTLLILVTPVTADDDVRVLVWNIQRGAAAFDDGPSKALAVIHDVQPDICLLQESYDIGDDRGTLGQWLAEQLGWNYYQGESPHLCILTPWTIDTTYFHAAWHGVGARLISPTGRALIAYSIWIDYRHYTPYYLRDHPDASDDELLAQEHTASDRLRQARAIIEHLREAGHLDADVPLLVGGDWNCPSHLDWTTETANVYRFRRALSLPVSTAMADAGFADAFRVVHPNPIQQPGITWSPLYLAKDGMPETADRIDRLYVRRPANDPTLRPTDAMVLPKPWEDPTIPIGQRVFPSDHGAVVVDMSWAPGPDHSG